VRADTRALPFATGSFALVVNLFTSFGYFRDDVMHLRVITEAGRITRPGGRFVLDSLHAAHVLGDYAGTPHDPASPRTILSARRQ
jgi:SAM-dependent methyltransferase